MCVCVCVCVCVEGYLDTYVSAATWPSKTKISSSAPGYVGEVYGLTISVSLFES